MIRTSYISNLYPVFTPPTSDKQRPAFIRYSMQRASEKDVARSELLYIIQPTDPKTGELRPRFRRLNEHRARALRAMVPALLYHFNIASGLVMASVEQLADECGLSTLSEAGNKSITRASRLITDFMEPMGLVVCEKVWDKLMASYIPKLITLTPLFFMLFGVSPEKLESAQNQQMGWINKGLLEKGEPSITLIEARRRAKEQHIKRAFEHRKSRYAINKQHKLARRIAKLDEQTAKQDILHKLVKRYSLLELGSLGSEGLRKQVDIEYYRLRKIASTPPPDIPVH
ncbi:plasmid replication initiator RepA [Candidatus Fukatsuia symbiotica]|uniref:Replication protein RepA n=1 Tax=Candidatus Fukatsuia symbiotica TaxID=1878942 RepID=A0A2U8I8Y8_9GAMM|nr:plasmid replication initiator RepA [Candidatus Fukatsuia symbiotica]AWK15642.1 replication protein RepA [Candidatus Fukatsuia symbiotica]MEA9446194.1 plasmid replication initiator RepA [Candidatus Fukatsuia symbiotica]